MDYKKSPMSTKKYKPLSSREYLPQTTDRPSSAEVIRNAKQWCALQAIQTRRPSTPRDASRSLFGSTAEGTRGNSRPPSAFSIGPQHFDPHESPSRPNSGAVTKSKLAPLNHKPLVPANPDLLVGRKLLTSSQRPLGDGSELAVRKIARPTAPRSPVKAVHDVEVVNRVDSFDQIDDKPSSVPSRYHPTPPPVRNKPRKSSPKTKEIVIPTATDDGRVHSSGSNVSSAGSGGRSGGDLGSGGGSSGQRSEESPEDAAYWNQFVLPLLEKLEDSARIGAPELCEVCTKIYTRLDEGSCFTRMFHRRRTSLLSALFRLLHIKSHDLHLLCSRIILQLRVTGKNLTSLCKLIFKICRDKQHDQLFIKYKLIGPMLSIFPKISDPLPKYEALVYMSGSLKFLSEDKVVAEEMLTNDALSVFTNFMDNTIESMLLHGDTKRQKYALDYLVQITAAFRNTMDLDKKAVGSLPSTSVFIKLLDVFGRDGTLAWNISRIFSKMTMYASATPYFLAHPGWAKVIMTSLMQHNRRTEVIVRLSFTLGNLSARNEEAREEVFFLEFDDDNQTSLSILLDIVDYYIDDVTADGDDITKEARDKSRATDVVVKIIRVIANLSIAERVGPLVAADERCVQMLSHILETPLVEETEELVVNSLATLSNLSFYDNKVVKEMVGAASSVTSNRLQLAVCLSRVMMADNMACVGEACRVFGNLTRHKDVRDLLHLHKVDLMMVALLDSSDRQVAYYACGNLVNMSADVEKRPPIVGEGAVQKLIDVLRDFAPTEWRIGGVVCQLIWNLVSAGSHLVDERNSIIEILQDFLDYDSVCSRCDVTGDAEARDYLLASWSNDFVQFATPLLDSMMSQVESDLVPLERPIESDHSSVEGT